MTYDQTRYEAMTLYPTLFVTEEDFLHHLFFVNGNGYEWENGQLVGIDAHIPFATRLKKQQDWNAKWKAERDAEREKDIAFYAEIGKEPPPHYAPPVHVRREIYPMCQFACILEIPDDVQPDWLEAARMALDYAFTLELTNEDIYWLELANMRVESLIVR